MRLANEVFEHLLGDLEIRYDAVFHRSDCLNVARRFAQHLFGLRANGFNSIGDSIHRDDRGLDNGNASAADIDQGVCCAKVNGKI
jgi:hypothetical protein